MHDSSSVPEEEVRRINEAGGKLDPSARGVDEEEYLPAAKLGVTKIKVVACPLSRLWCLLRFRALSCAGFFDDKNGTERAMKYDVRAAAVKNTF